MLQTYISLIANHSGYFLNTVQSVSSTLRAHLTAVFSYTGVHRISGHFGVWPENRWSMVGSKRGRLSEMMSRLCCLCR